MSGGRLHVIGAGLAGLAAALAWRGPVTLWEAAPQAGGRCRSLQDARLGEVIDTGSHLVLGANRALRAFAARTGGRLVPGARADFPFHDLGTDAEWTLRPGAGPLPLWLADPARRVPGAQAADHLRGLWRLLMAGPGETVDACLGPDEPLLRPLWDPLCRAVLNTPPQAASARLLAAVLRRTLIAGGSACRPLFVPRGLSPDLIDPALGTLRSRDADFHPGCRIAGLDCDGDGAGGRVRALHPANGAPCRLAPDDRVVLAVPAAAAAGLLPGLPVPPGGSRCILNAHFRAPEAAQALPPLLGLLGGSGDWVFCRGKIVSVTVSAAEDLARLPAGVIAARLWRDVARPAGGDPQTVPPARVIKEKRATPDQTPAFATARPGPSAGPANLALAGDWTRTGLPATLEGAVRSGRSAARLLARRG